MEKMKDMKHFIVFMLEDKTFALPLDPVERVVRAVEITTLPEAPAIVCGIINYRGTVLPVIDIRSGFHLPRRDLRLSDQFIIVQTAVHRIALLVDTVIGDIEKNPGDVIPPSDLFDGVEFLIGVIKLEEGVMLIPDLDKILTHKETRALTKAMEKTQKTQKSQKTRKTKKAGK
jgi:purine-binding chemotaxis protein CheW